MHRRNSSISAEEMSSTMSALPAVSSPKQQSWKKGDNSASHPGFTKLKQHTFVMKQARNSDFSFQIRVFPRNKKRISKGSGKNQKFREFGIYLHRTFEGKRKLGNDTMTECNNLFWSIAVNPRRRVQGKIHFVKSLFSKKNQRLTSVCSRR